jgi:hypothetical protein
MCGVGRLEALLHMANLNLRHIFVPSSFSQPLQPCSTILLLSSGTFQLYDHINRTYGQAQPLNLDRLPFGVAPTKGPPVESKCASYGEEVMADSSLPKT